MERSPTDARYATDPAPRLERTLPLDPTTHVPTCYAAFGRKLRDPVDVRRRPVKRHLGHTTWYPRPERGLLSRPSFVASWPTVRRASGPQGLRLDISLSVRR